MSVEIGRREQRSFPERQEIDMLFMYSIKRKMRRTVFGAVRKRDPYEVRFFQKMQTSQNQQYGFLC